MEFSEKGPSNSAIYSHWTRFTLLGAQVYILLLLLRIPWISPLPTTQQ